MSKCSNYVCEGKEVVAINSLVKWQCDWSHWSQVDILIYNSS